MTRFPLAAAALLLAAACGDTARAQRYESLQAELKAIRQETTGVDAEVDRLFYEATSSERLAGKAITGASRCVAPKGSYHQAPPLAFGPVGLRSQQESWLFREGALFETNALQCVQATVTSP